MKGTIEQYHSLMKLRSRLETFYYSLGGWELNNLDNENVSDGLWGFVKDMKMDVRRELKETENQLFHL